MRARIRQLTDSGARIVHVCADVTSRQDVAELVRLARERFGRVAGVLHAAGELRDGFVLRKSRADAEAVLAPKVRGAELLDEATRDEPLAYFVLFSSTAAVLASAGQSDYAFANAHLDHFAERREQRRLRGESTGRTLSVNWPLWRDGGMAMDTATQDAMRRELGFSPLPADLALTALERALATDAPRLLLATGDATVIARVLRTGGAPVAAEPLPESTAAGGLPGAGDDFRPRMERFLVELLAAELKMTADDIALDEPFDRYGIDSLMVMSLTRSLEESFGTLSKTLFFEYFDVAELAGHFLTEHADRLPEVLGTGSGHRPKNSRCRRHRRLAYRERQLSRPPPGTTTTS